MAGADVEFRRGLADALAGIVSILFAVALQLAGLGIGFPYQGAFACGGLLIAVTGALFAALGVLRIGRSAELLET